MYPMLLIEKITLDKSHNINQSVTDIRRQWLILSRESVMFPHQEIAGFGENLLLSIRFA